MYMYISLNVKLDVLLRVETLFINTTKTTSCQITIVSESNNTRSGKVAGEKYMGDITISEAWKVISRLRNK